MIFKDLDCIIFKIKSFHSFQCLFNKYGNQSEKHARLQLRFLARTASMFWKRKTILTTESAFSPNVCGRSKILLDSFSSNHWIFQISRYDEKPCRSLKLYFWRIRIPSLVKRNFELQSRNIAEVPLILYWLPDYRHDENFYSCCLLIVISFMCCHFH